MSKLWGWLKKIGQGLAKFGLGNFIGWAGAILFVITLCLTVAAIGLRWESAAQYLELTGVLLSWKVIGTAAATGFVVAFREPLGGVIKRLGLTNPQKHPRKPSN